MGKISLSIRKPNNLFSAPKKMVVGTNMASHLIPTERDVFHKNVEMESAQIKRLRLKYEERIEANGARSQEAKIAKLALISSELSFHDNLRRLAITELQRITNKTKVTKEDHKVIDFIVDRIKDHGMRMYEIEEEITRLKDQLARIKQK